MLLRRFAPARCCAEAGTTLLFAAVLLSCSTVLSPSAEKRPLDGTLLQQVLLSQQQLSAGEASPAARLYHDLARDYPETPDIHLFAVNYASLAGDKKRLTTGINRLLERYHQDKTKLSDTQLQQLFLLAASLQDISLLEHFHATLLAQRYQNRRELIPFFLAADAQQRRANNGVVVLRAAQLLLDNRPSSLHRHLIVIRLSIAHKKYAEAERWMYHARDHHHGHSDTFTHLEALIAFERGDHNQAKMLVDRLSAAKIPPHHLLLKARIYGSLGTAEQRQAEQWLKELRDNPKYQTEADYELATIYMRQRQFAAAEAVLKGINPIGNGFNRAYELARLYYFQGDFMKAMLTLRDMQPANQPQAVRKVLFVARIFYTSGDKASALRVFDFYLNSYPNSPDVLYQRAILRLNLNDAEGFEQDMRKILAINENHTEAYNTLGYVLADQLKRYDEALPLIQKAIQLQPNESHILDSMGWVLFHLKRYDEAKHFLQRSLQLKFDPEVVAHMSELLWTIGQQQEAKKLWNQGISKFPKAEILRATGKRLKLGP